MYRHFICDSKLTGVSYWDDMSDKVVCLVLLQTGNRGASRWVTVLFGNNIT